MGLMDRFLVRQIQLVYNGELKKGKVTSINGLDYTTIGGDLFELCYQDGIAYRVNDRLKRREGHPDHSQVAIVRETK